jgi:hypothetical protein
MAEKGNAAKRAFRQALRDAPPTVPRGWHTAHDRETRLWGLIAAIDTRIAREVGRDKPNGELIRDLCTARKTLLAQADGPEPTKAQANGAAVPVLAEPVPVQE